MSIDIVLGASVGAAIFICGFMFGRFFPERKSTKLRCGCGHTKGFHVGGKGSCKSQPWDSVCKCQMYDGPITYDQYLAQELEP
jgi:hypothetical protein